MIDRVEILNRDDYLQKFSRKFENALRRMPILPEKVTVRDNIVTILNEEEEYTYKINFNKEVETLIFEIRQDLYDKWFPVITFSNRREERLSVSDIKRLIEDGIPLEEALTRTHVTEEVEEFKINRVVVNRDEVFIKSTKDPEDERMYRMNMPVTIFLKRLREGRISNSGDFFEKKSVFVKKIYPEKEWNKILKD